MRSVRLAHGDIYVVDNINEAYMVFFYHCGFQCIALLSREGYQVNMAF